MELQATGKLLNEIILELKQCDHISPPITLTNENPAKKPFWDQIWMAKLITLTNLITLSLITLSFGFHLQWNQNHNQNTFIALL